MKLQLFKDDFSICRLGSLKDVDIQKPLYFLAQTDEEISLVCPSGEVPSSCRERDDGWHAMRLAGTLDLSLIGVLAPIAELLAQNSIGIFVVSTFNTDYIFVRASEFESACRLLAAAGYESEWAVLP